MKFEVGKTYAKRSLSDSSYTYRVRILKRTASTVTVDLEGCGGLGVKNFRVSAYNGAEFFKPLGSYALAPIISADAEEAPAALSPSEMVQRLQHQAAALPSEESAGVFRMPIGRDGVRLAIERLAKMAAEFADALSAPDGPKK